jgi:hypothetical protein
MAVASHKRRVTRSTAACQDVLLRLKPILGNYYFSRINCSTRPSEAFSIEKPVFMVNLIK